MSTAPVATNGHANSGFTLIEVLVALVLVSLLALIIVGAIGQMRSISANSKFNDADVEMQAFGNYLEKVIAGAKPLALIGDNPDRRIMFSGTAEQLRFSSVIRTGSNQLALRDVEIKTVSTTGKLKLVEVSNARRVGEPYLGVGVSSAPITLIGDLKEFRVEYLESSQGSSSSPKWLEVWDQRDKMPRAIKFKIAAERFSRLVWVERIVHLRLGP